jgi:hypothetical protein
MTQEALHGLDDTHKAAAGIFAALPDDPFDGEGEDEAPAGTEQDQDAPAVADEDDDLDAEAAEALTDDDDESAEEDEEADEEEDEEESEDEAEDEADEEDAAGDEDLRYTIKVDGEEVEATLQELKDGYSRTASWTKKSQALAQERQAFAAQRETVKRMETEYAARLQHLEVQMRANLPTEPSPSDPQAWIRYRQEMDQLQQVQAERAAVQEKLQSEHLQERAAMVEAENAKLMEEIPEWRDPAVALADKRSLAKFAIGVLGFEEDDIDQIVDARVVKLIRMAKESYDLNEAKGKVKGKTKAAKKVLKPGQPSRKSASAKAKSKRGKAARDALSKSGHVNDAAAFIHDNLLD